jgi:F-box-like
VDCHQGFESKVEKFPAIMMDTTTTVLRTSPGRTESCITSRLPAPLSLPNLPPELLLVLFSFLDYGSLLELGATNKHFRSLVRREHIVAALYRNEDVIRDATSLRDEQIACFKCYRLRSAFFDFDKRGIQPKFTAKGEQAGRRRCLICLMPTSPPKEKVVEKDGKRCSDRLDDAHSNKLRVVPHG